jgi:hypothetical protein
MITWISAKLLISKRVYILSITIPQVFTEMNINKIMRNDPRRGSFLYSQQRRKGDNTFSIIFFM